MPDILPSSEWPARIAPGTVIFVRHGQKAGGGFSADLTEKGRRDATEVGRALSDKVDFFIASPSPRTVSTAECIREGNGSDARILQEEQLAEPGLGLYTEFRPAMKSFMTRILEIVEVNRAQITVAVTHNFVVDYVAAVFGGSGESDLLCGLIVDVGLIRAAVEQL